MAPHDVSVSRSLRYIGSCLAVACGTEREPTYEVVVPREVTFCGRSSERPTTAFSTQLKLRIKPTVIDAGPLQAWDGDGSESLPEGNQVAFDIDVQSAAPDLGVGTSAVGSIVAIADHNLEGWEQAGSTWVTFVADVTGPGPNRWALIGHFQGEENASYVLDAAENEVEQSLRKLSFGCSWSEDQTKPCNFAGIDFSLGLFVDFTECRFDWAPVHRVEIILERGRLVAHTQRTPSGSGAYEPRENYLTILRMFGELDDAPFFQDDWFSVAYSSDNRIDYQEPYLGVHFPDPIGTSCGLVVDGIGLESPARYRAYTLSCDGHRDEEVVVVSLTSSDVDLDEADQEADQHPT